MRVNWIALGALLAGLAVAAGALAAHGLEGVLARQYAGQTRSVGGETIPAARKYLADFRTAAEYQMSHGLALVLTGLLARVQSGRRSWDVAGWCFLAGIVLFSGMLYLLVLSGQRWLGMIVPIGGVLFLVGWSAVLIGAMGRAPGRE